MGYKHRGAKGAKSRQHLRCRASSVYSEMLYRIGKGIQYLAAVSTCPWRIIHATPDMATGRPPATGAFQQKD